MNWNFRPTLAVQHKIDEYNLAPGSNSSKYQRVSPPPSECDTGKWVTN